MPWQSADVAIDVALSSIFQHREFGVRVWAVPEAFFDAVVAIDSFFEPYALQVGA
jgi:hypothetical protein